MNVELQAQAADVIDGYLRERAGDLSWERVRDDFWFIRIPGTARRWIPVEVTVGQRTVKAISYYVIEPEESQAEAYRYVLRNNFAGGGVAFASAPDRTLCLVGRTPLERFSTAALDQLVGTIVDTTERTFQSFLRIGFAARFREQPAPLPDCLACRANLGDEVLAPGGPIYEDWYWRIEHALSPAPLEGWLVLKPLRHCEGTEELTAAEAEGLGPLLQRATEAVKQACGAEKVYVVFFGEAVGHLHIHLIPRRPDHPEDLRGPDVFELLRRAQTNGGVPDGDAAAKATEIRQLMAAW